VPRPERLVLVVGTGTEVGKTWVACALARALRATGVEVAARKPAQSFDPADPGPTDAELLAAATGETAGEVCRPELTYPVPMAPPMAAAALGRPAPAMVDLVGGLADGAAWGDALGVGIVEAAGGVRSPLADDGDSVDLARAIGPDLVVLVADAGLGTIHAVRSAAAPLADWPLAVMLNRYDAGADLHRRNRAWRAERDRLPVYTDVAAVLGDLLARERR
jgi:dethiobiotin synthetase